MRQTSTWVTWIAVVASVLPLATVAADFTPLQLSIWPPVQLFDEKTDVIGLRLSVPGGRNEDVSGLDVGILNQTDRQETAIEAGMVNACEGSFGGAQLAGLANWNRLSTASGLQVAGGVNRNVGLSRFTGLQIAGVGSWNDDADFAGVQVSGIGGGGGAIIGVFGGGGGGGIDKEPKCGDVIGIQITGGGCLVVLPIPNAVAGFLTGNAAKTLVGAQIAGLGINVAEKDGFGLQMSGIANGAEQFHGLQAACLLNGAGPNSASVQVGAVNFAAERPPIGGPGGGNTDTWRDAVAYYAEASKPAAGLQIGCYNECYGHYTGVQIGVYNHVQKLTGIQIGVFNIICGSPVKFLPLVNAWF